jgi:hypothetical protein
MMRFATSSDGDLLIAFSGGKSSVEALKVRLADVDAVHMPAGPLLQPDNPTTR